MEGYQTEAANLRKRLVHVSKLFERKSKIRSKSANGKYLRSFFYFVSLFFYVYFPRRCRA
jgi:hypothetical protein